MRRHPRAWALHAWFDGEDAPGVGSHLDGCERCRRRVVELCRVRAAMRGDPVPVPLPAAVRRWRPVVAPVAVALVLVALLVATTVPGTLSAPFRAAGHLFDGGSETGRAASPATTPTLAPGPAPTGQPQGGATPTSSGPESPATSAPSPDAAPVLRLAVVVPMAGPLAADGAQTVDAVRQVVDAANRAGGVAGRPVELVVVDAGDADAVANLAGAVSVAVGGFGATPPVPWLFPADPYARGSLAAETPAAEAGAVLARDLARRGIRGTVAAVVSDGPDAALADGVERAAPVFRITATASSSCDSEVRAARGALPAALVLAVAPDLAGRCLEAAARLGWRPPGGVLLAPSAAYAGLERDPAAAGGRTVLGLPWPTGDEPGASRFRATVPGVGSYRALVAYAAAELAVTAARASSPLRLADLAHGTWQTDLVTLSDGVNVAARIVVAGPAGWATTAAAS